eukprot:scpid83634/ scgid33495/ 
MAMVLARREVGIKVIGRKVEVPDSPKARLMYYLHCIFDLLREDDFDEDVRRLARYENWHGLSLRETQALLKICTEITPGMLKDKLFHQHDSMCGEHLNQFHSFEEASSYVVIANSVFIAGKQLRITKIMTYKDAWMQKKLLEGPAGAS